MNKNTNEKQRNKSCYNCSNFRKRHCKAFDMRISDTTNATFCAKYEFFVGKWGM